MVRAGETTPHVADETIRKYLPMSITVTSFDDKSALLEAMEARLREALSKPSDRPFAIMISGGSTPLPVYGALANKPPEISPNAGIVFADDRYVPVDSTDSNYGNALPMINGLGIPEGRTLRIHPELTLDEAAERYNKDLKGFLTAGGSIPLAFLGLGADGHTCSLFSDADLERCAGKLAAAIPKESPPDRITVSPELLARVGHIIFVVAGDDKIDMIDALVDKPDTITAGKAVARCKSVELWRT